MPRAPTGQAPQQVNWVRCNLASAIFPFYTQGSGRTIVVPQYDENFDRYNAANTTPDKGVPQVYYMENILPIANGFQSVAYNQALPPFLAGDINATDFDNPFTLYSQGDSGSVQQVLFVPAGGKNYVYDATVGAWASVSPIDPSNVTIHTIVTVATINGQSYFTYANYGTFMYDTTTKLMVKVTLITLTDADVVGITATNGYMLAWTSTTIAWSSLVNPLDFTPSIQTGAGGGVVQARKGSIRFCFPIVNGFLLYCNLNIVGATYNNNVNYPFLFREIPDSGGCLDPSLVAWQNNLDTHVALTSNGLQAVNLSGATTVMPEVTDFLAAQIYETYNYETDVIETEYLGNQVYVKLSATGDRFIVISYGPTLAGFTYAIIFDTVLNRYGRLQLPHRASFQYIDPNLYVGATYDQLLAEGVTYSDLQYTSYDDLGSNIQTYAEQKQTLGFLQQDGRVLVVDFSLGNSAAQGVFLLGKFQFDRAHFIVHQQTFVESINEQSQANFEMKLMLTLDGKTFLPSVPTVMTPKPGGLSLTFSKRATGQNMSLLFKGAYELTTVVTTFTLGGYR